MLNLDSKTQFSLKMGYLTQKHWVYHGMNEGTGSPKLVQGRETQLLTTLAKTKLWAARTLHEKVQRRRC